ncbi:MAG: hypothetical protein Q9182_006506 [Xanthomendoza sp. 2 TL-2023]
MTHIALEGDLAELIDEFSDGRVQFAFVRVKDPNTTLPKFVLIAWCGEGVPERTKGYFTNHLAAVSKVLYGYHVQVTARSDRDLTPESIVQKVADASGSKYSNSSSGPPSSAGSPPHSSSKPVFTPTESSRGTSSFNPLRGTRLSSAAAKDANVDEDGWGQDAPPVTRTGLVKVQSSYQPTKVNMHELSSQKPEQPSFMGARKDSEPSGDVVKGGYQPVGKVDIAALRRQAQEKGSYTHDRPNVVRGSYEPVGKVDIAAIKARAQQSSERDSPSSISPAVPGASSRNNDRGEEQERLPDRSAPFTSSERLISLPKPKVANRFGGGSTNVTGTKAPTPGGFGMESKPTSTTTSVGVGRTFADQGGKTPAQQWAEKKARERGLSGASDTHPPPQSGAPASSITNQWSGSGEWKGGYTGKNWAAVQSTRTGQSTSSVREDHSGEGNDVRDDTTTIPTGGIGAIRDRFKDAPPMGAASTSARDSAPSPPPLATSNKPNAGRGIPIPGLPMRPPQARTEDKEETRMPTPPAQPPRSPTPPTPPAVDSGSPIRVVMPVARGQQAPAELDDAREEQFSPPPAMPTQSLAQQIPHEDDLTDEPSGHDPARAAGQAVGAAALSESAAAAHLHTHEGGRCALVQFDYEKAEDNEIEIREGEHVMNIDMVDADWWMGENIRGEVGLFPSNYVELVEAGGDDDATAATSARAPYPTPARETEAESTKRTAPNTADKGHTATALYDYDAQEDNELSFPETAKITGIEFPDDDWWSGEYKGKQGLFPANYVQLDQ